MKKVVKLVLNIIPRTILTRLSYIIKPLIKIYLFGNKYTDPIDGSSFRKFLPYGYNNVRGGKYTNSTSLHRTKINEETRKYMESNTKIIHLDDNYVPQDQVETKNEEEWLYGDIF